MTQTALQTTTRAQQRFAEWSIDILVYTVVLNLFVEHHRAIEIDSFTISIFTAVLLTALLDLIVGVEDRVSGYFKGKETTLFRVLGVVVTFLILFLSKFLILEVVDIVFGDDAGQRHSRVLHLRRPRSRGHHGPRPLRAAHGHAGSRSRADLGSGRARATRYDRRVAWLRLLEAAE